MPLLKKSNKAYAREAMQANGYDPLDVLVNVAGDPSTPQALKLDIARDLLPYMYPKLTAVEIEAHVDTTVDRERHEELLRRVMSTPELADAAQRLSLEAAGVLIGAGSPIDDNTTIQ